MSNEKPRERGKSENSKLLLLLLLLASASAQAATAFLKYERLAGMNKICVYERLGSEYAITIRATELCPLTIDV